MAAIAERVLNARQEAWFRREGYHGDPATQPVRRPPKPHYILHVEHDPDIGALWSVSRIGGLPGGRFLSSVDALKAYS